MIGLRSREMAVRVALGAEPGALRRLVLRQTVGVIVLGIALGLGGAAAVTRFLGALLFGVAPTDPASRRPTRRRCWAPWR